MGEAEPREGIGAWPWVAMGVAGVALTVRIVIMRLHPGGDGLPSANFHPWIFYAGLPALALSVVALLLARRARQPQGALVAGFVTFFNLLMIFISL